MPPLERPALTSQALPYLLAVGLALLWAAAVPNRGLAEAPSGSGPTAASLPALLQAVAQQNPELETIELRIQALEHAEAQSDVWSDPVAAFEYSNMPLSTPWPSKHPMSGLQFKLQQTFPWPGKTGTRRDASRARTSVARHELAERRNHLLGLTATLYHRLALSRQLRTVTRTHVDLVEQFIEVIRVGYEVGVSNQADLLRLEVLRDQLGDDLLEFDSEAEALVAALNATAHRAAGSAIDTPERTTTLGPPAVLEALVERARKNRPELHRLQAAAKAEQLSAQQADVERRPDITTWLGYRVRLEVDGGDPGEDFLTAGVSMPLPWFWNDRRWGEKAQQHRAQGHSLDAAREAAIDRIRGTVDAALAHWRRARDRATRYREELMPVAHQTLDATLAAYQVGRADFASLFQAELQLLAFEKTIYVAESAAALAQTQIETELGLSPGALTRTTP